MAMPSGGLAIDTVRRSGSSSASSSKYDPTTAWKERMALYEKAKSDVEGAWAGISESADASWAQRKADVRSDAAAREAQAQSQLNRLGMGGTTVAPTLGEGFSRYMNAELNRINEMAGQQSQAIQLARAGALTNLAGMNLQSADTYNMANLQAGLQREQTASNEYLGSLDPMLRASGAYVRGTTAGASWRNPWSS